MTKVSAASVWWGVQKAKPYKVSHWVCSPHAHRHLSEFPALSGRFGNADTTKPAPGPKAALVPSAGSDCNGTQVRYRVFPVLKLCQTHRRIEGKREDVHFSKPVVLRCPVRRRSVACLSPHESGQRPTRVWDSVRRHFTPVSLLSVICHHIAAS